MNGAPEFEDYTRPEITEARIALSRAGDLQVFGSTNDARYIITDLGRRKLEALNA